MLKPFFISLLTAASVYVSAQAPFQGTLTFKGENKSISETTEVVWQVKDGNSRLDITSNTAAAPNVQYSLYFVQGQNAVKMVAESGAGGKKVYDIPYSAFANGEFTTAFSVEATGQKGRYAGYDCEEYVVKTANTVVSCWVSNATGINPSSFPSIVLGRGVFSALQRNGIQGIPLKIVSKDFAGNVVSDQELVSIQVQAVPDNVFVVPSLEKGN